MHRLADVGGHQPRFQRQAVAAQPGDPLGEETERQGMRGGDLQHFPALPFEVVQVAHHLAHLLDHAARGHQEQLPRLGELHRGAGAVHQGQAQGAFQAADAPAERRLGDETPLGRLGEAAGGGQGDEVLQPLGLDVHCVSLASGARAIRSVPLSRHADIMPIVHDPARNGIGRKQAAILILAPHRGHNRIPSG